MPQEIDQQHDLVTLPKETFDELVSSIDRMEEFYKAQNSTAKNMADQAVEGDVYIYRGGRAPQHITHAIIDKSVTEIDDYAFHENENLRYVKTHDGLKRIGRSAFHGCESLTEIDLRSVKILDSFALAESGLTKVDCDNLVIVGSCAFAECDYLRCIKLPSVKEIHQWTFYLDDKLTEVELPEVEHIQSGAFGENHSLRRIAIPLKADLFVDAVDDDPDPEDWSDSDTGGDKDALFHDCDSLVQVDLVGWIHETVSSFHLESWRYDMNKEIKKINRVLPVTSANEKTMVIRWWLASVSSKVEHYKGEHRRVLKEAATILELALWKVNLHEENEEESRKQKSKKAKIDVERARKKNLITSGADIVIKNVLPFLELK
jgi:hypothetical protein